MRAALRRAGEEAADMDEYLRALWTTWAAENPIDTRKGPGQTVTWEQAWTHYCALRSRALPQPICEGRPSETGEYLWAVTTLAIATPSHCTLTIAQQDEPGRLNTDTARAIIAIYRLRGRPQGNRAKALVGLVQIDGSSDHPVPRVFTVTIPPVFVPGDRIRVDLRQSDSNGDCSEKSISELSAE